MSFAPGYTGDPNADMILTPLSRVGRGNYSATPVVAPEPGRGIPAPLNYGNDVRQMIIPAQPSGVPAAVPGVRTAPASQSSYAGLVLLRFPTGEVRNVPADQVAFYLAQGARRI